MKITREQVNKINARMGNGWRLDLYYMLMHSGEKTAEITIPMDDGGYVRGKLYIDNVHDWRAGAYNGVQIKLNVSRWYKGSTEGVYTSSGLGKWIKQNRPDMTRCLFSEVEKITHRITAADIMAIYEGNAELCENPVMLGAAAATV